MEIRAINALAALRAVLLAPGAERDREFVQQVMEPTRPLWETALQRMGAPTDTSGAVWEAARRLCFYTPDRGPERALEALGRLEAAGAWEQNLSDLRRASEALAPAAHGVNLPALHFAFVLADPDRMMPGTALYTGATAGPGWAMLLAWPTDYNLPRLSAVSVHELHHQVRFGYEPLFPDLSLGKYLVAEGLAEAFAAELCGEVRLGPWATTLTPADLEPLKPRYRAALQASDFNEVRGYIFGDLEETGAWGVPKLGLPPYAGYAVGYRMVRAYLERSGRSAVEATYLPWQEIVQGSGYLD
ncbi:uncharacterized protein YjaZ [Deinobacterium chartae]|uniref:Uncharacterized protein YjaZ n=1 Tax=Deinobacterium chartae TaxID=521158 RepID=A0A841HZ07_9DEIO|nr:DUF2268 domain-containing putative Zn-dependent protease [Deinobacterium chartae]MBB6098627.1 uncharacterized protein YjaZ [Deinobacterium chartae]